MQKNIDKKNRIIYIPSSPDEDIFHNPQKKKNSLKIDGNYKYKKNIFICAWQWVFYFCIARPIFGIYGRLFLGIKVVGKKNLKNIKTGAVTVSNHVHYLDFSIATTFIARWRRSHIISTKENLDVPFAGKLAAGYGVIPLPETPSASSNFLRHIDSLLAKKRFIHVFPEASMWPYYTGLRPFKPGAFNFACRNNVPVVPYLLVFRKSKGVKKIIRKRPKITVIISKPIYPNPELDKKSQIRDLCEKTTLALETLRKENPSYEYYLYVDPRKTKTRKQTPTKNTAKSQEL